MIYKKRGNIFENLKTIEDDSATISDQGPGGSDQDKDFRDLRRRLDGIKKDSSEVMEVLKRLQSQIEEIKYYFDEGFDDEDEVFEIDDKYFRLAYINPQDEGENLFKDYEDEDKLRSKAREVAEAAKGLMQTVIAKRESKKKLDHVEEDAEGQAGDQVQEGRREGRQVLDEHCRWEQGRPDGGAPLSAGGKHLHQHHDKEPLHDGHPEVQEMVRGPGRLPLGHEGHGGLPNQARTTPSGGGGDPSGETQSHEDPRGPRCTKGGQIQVGGRHGQTFQSKTPEPRDGEEEADGEIDEEHEDSRDDEDIKPETSRISQIANKIRKICDLYKCKNVPYFSGLEESQKRYERHRQRYNQVTISEAKIMTRIPSKCPTCKVDLPSLNALKAHKASAHPTPSKPPGPSMKAKDGGKKKSTPNKGKEVKEIKPSLVNVGASTSAAAETGAIPKTPKTTTNTTGSVEVMNRWMSGSSRSTAIATALANSASENKSETGQEIELEVIPIPTLEESVNLLATTQGDSGLSDSAINVRTPAAPGPRVSTLRLWPPEMEAIPVLEVGGEYILRQSMTGESQEEPRGEREKGKRELERYEDDVRSRNGKKFDEKSTPEEIRNDESSRSLYPRNLSRDLESQDVLDTQEVMEVEYGGDTDPFDIEGHNVNLVSNSANTSEAPTIAVTEGNQEELSIAERLMSTSERDWMNSATFSTIPPSPEHGETTTDNPNSYGDDIDDLLYFKNARIDELTVKLEEALSNNQDHSEVVGSLENKVADLEAGVAHYRGMVEQVNANAASSCSKLQDDVDKLKRETELKNDMLEIKKAEMASMTAEVERLKRELEEKTVLTDTAAMEVESVKAESMEAMRKIQIEVKRIENEANSDKEKAEKKEADLIAQINKLQGERRAEQMRMEAINKKTLHELKTVQDERRQQQAKFDEVTQVRAALVKAQTERDRALGERDLEKLKATKAEDSLRKYEEIMKEAQEERGRKDFRIGALEHSNKILSRSQPCERQPGTCDFTCGRDHHCGTPTIRTRRRSRSRGGAGNPTNNPQPDETPTVANMATAAGVPVNKMQQVVNDQAQVQAQASAQAARLPPRPTVQFKAVGLCRNYHYHKLCLHGDDCKFAHQLVAANAMKGATGVGEGGARALSQALNKIQRQPPPPQQPQPQAKPRSRSASNDRKKFHVPAYHPEHPDYDMIMAMSNANNVNGAAANVVNNPRPAGNVREQSSTGAGSVPAIQPQVFKPQLQRPRAASTSVASEVLEARKTVHSNMTQQASNQARMKAMKDTAWKESMDSVLSMVSKTYTNSAGAKNSSAVTQDSSEDQV